MDWKAPEIAVTLGGVLLDAPVVHACVRASRFKPVSTIDLEISNLHFELSDVALSRDVALAVSWGYRGDDLTPLFDGAIETCNLRETARIIGACRGRQLRDTKRTITYQEEAINRMAEHLVRDLEFTALDFEDDLDRTLDKLPLYQTPILRALANINRRLSLGRDLWVGPEGTLHWAVPDRTQDPVRTFVDGEDVLEFSPLALGGRKLVTLGADLWHSCVVAYTERDDNTTSYFVDEVQHEYRSGPTTTLWLSEVSE